MKNVVIGSTLAVVVAGLAIGAAIADSRGAGPMGGRGGMDERPSFTELDTDGDGNVTIAEMRARSAARFAEADTDGDGKLTSEELVAAASARTAERAAARMGRMIEWRDTDGDGMLSLAEMGGDAGPKMFERLDADDDGMISEEEFSAMQERGKMGRGREGHGERDGHGKRGKGMNSDRG